MAGLLSSKKRRLVRIRFVIAMIAILQTAGAIAFVLAADLRLSSGRALPDPAAITIPGPDAASPIQAPDDADPSLVFAMLSVWVVVMSGLLVSIGRQLYSERGYLRLGGAGPPAAVPSHLDAVETDSDSDGDICPGCGESPCNRNLADERTESDSEAELYESRL